MKWSRIAAKLGTTVLLLIFIILLTLGIALDQLFTGFYKNLTYQEMDTLTNRVTSMMQMHMHERQDPQMFEMMARVTGGDLHIINRDGDHVFISNDSHFPNMHALDDQEIQQLSRGVRIQYETLDVRKEPYLVSAKPIMENNQFVGAIYLFSPIGDVYDSIYKVRQWLLLSGLGAMLVAAGFMYMASSQMTKPLLQMERAARRMSKGELDIKVDAVSKDEMGSLATAINDLAYDLKRHRDTRSAFFANISHELRTPITYLQGYSDVLQKELYDSEEEKLQYIRVIHEEAGRLKGLVQDLFELANMEEGQFSMEREPTDLARVLAECVQRLELRVKEKGISLVKRIPEEQMIIDADARRLEQIFINLLDNAIRYTHEGTISIEAAADENEVTITISDTGVGIPEEELPYIFERFYRVEKSRSRELGGTGLGLAIVKKLVELQGGTIEVRSEWGRGTAMRVIFVKTV